jgi:aryl sulfotransferase
MPDAPLRYQSAEEDSDRWRAFPFRPGDIVISTRSKSGTTWMQMICALLIFQTSELPEPLPSLSPWLDWLVTPRDEVYARLAGQRHRRFIKTHTPLDGVPIEPEVTYLVVARHPLDLAVSLYHQGATLDRERIRSLGGTSQPEDRSQKDRSGKDESGKDRSEQSRVSEPVRPAVRDWLLSWIERDPDPRTELDSLPGVMWHLSDAWHRRHQPNVVLVHYDDLSADLAGQMRRLAGLLGITVPEPAWPELVEAATFGGMQRRADQLAPDAAGVLKDRARFFRAGRSGAGRGRSWSAGPKSIRRSCGRCMENPIPTRRVDVPASLSTIEATAAQMRTRRPR